MSEMIELEIPIEPERYELQALPTYIFKVDRRNFLKIFGTGIFVVSVLDHTAIGQDRAGQGESGRRGGRAALPKEIGAWLRIDENGDVTVFTGKVEIGQDIRTTLTQIVSEELTVPVKSIQLVMGDTDLTPFDQGTFGSQSTPQMGPQLRRAAAAAREVLIEQAADEWKVSRDSLSAADGRIINTLTKKTVTFGQLAKGQKIVKLISDSAPTVPADKWKTAGASIPKINGRDFVTGKHQYTPDIKRPGMLYGKVVRPSAFNATLVSADASKAKAVSGVTVVQDGNFIGVAAPRQDLAASAAEMVKAEWNAPQQPSSKDLFSYLKSKGAQATPAYSSGSMTDGLAAADIKGEATFTIAYIAHAPLEPRSAVAEWDADGKLTVWTGSQRPFGVRGELAQAFHIPEEKVRVIIPDTGSGYGGKHTGDAAIEAARLAKAAGKPVKVTWTREEEFTWAYFRPGGVIDITSGVKKDGTITAWEFHNYNSGPSGITSKYEIPNQKIVFHQSDSPLRQGSYRGLAATANHFAREAYIDELAHAVNMDALEFRMKNLKDPRQIAVLEAAATKFGWGKIKNERGHACGLAIGFEKGGYLAVCAEVTADVSTGKVKVVRAVQSFECGAIVNPDHLKNQMEGAIMMGLGGALFEAINFENGKILNNHFSQYRVPRFNDMPQIEIVLVDRKDLPSAGAGETPLMGIAPAVANAIFNATGIRLRSLPMVPNGLKPNTDTKPPVAIR
ncbi:MAG TPA: molybdopterin cofactor-binding domain-containing protein [Blastocatellia bacterium]|nr:molybdopterin cofactor-binding domain-containing protein [Blastocatellia bacterium]